MNARRMLRGAARALTRARVALGCAAGALPLLVAAPTVARAQVQVVTGGDFDIDDNGGTVTGNRARLVGRAGFGTNRGTFVLVNAADATQDVDRDGYTAGVDFTSLVVSDTTDFV